MLRDKELKLFYWNLGRELKQQKAAPFGSFGELLVGRSIMCQTMASRRLSLSANVNMTGYPFICLTFKESDVKAAIKASCKKRFFSPDSDSEDIRMKIALANLRPGNKERNLKKLNALHRSVVDLTSQALLFRGILDSGEIEMAITYSKSRMFSERLKAFAAIEFAERDCTKALEQYDVDILNRQFSRHELIGILFAAVRNYPVDLKFMPRSDLADAEKWDPECYDTYLTPECCLALGREAVHREQDTVIDILWQTQPAFKLPSDDSSAS